MTPLDRVLDGLEAAWIAAADLDPHTRPDELGFVLWKAGQLIETHRPGLFDRLLASLDSAAPQRCGCGFPDRHTNLQCTTIEETI